MSAMSASGLYVAGRGDRSDPIGGLFRFHETVGGWSGSRLAAVPQLSSLAHHPELPVVYGTSGSGADGRVHAWRIDTGRTEDAEPLSEVGSDGAGPCHVCVDPAARSLIVCNYTSASIALWRLGAVGSIICPATVISLQGNGSGVDANRQDRPHPHQATFVGDELLVTDLGADCLRRFSIDAERSIAEEIARHPLPAGSGPRHLVQTATGSVAVTTELSGELAVSSPDLSRWQTIPATLRSGPAGTRSATNYPGDLQKAADGRIGFLANRGYDTISVFSLGDAPRLLAEVDAGVRWPQHLLIAGGRLLIAGEDSSQVVALPLDPDRVPGSPETLFDCPGACWLLPVH